jgi:serine protease Do
MNDFNEYNLNPIGEPPKNSNKKGSGKWRGFLSMMSAGVVGSLLTIAVVPHTDYIDNLYSSVGEKVSQLSNQVESINNSADAVKVQKTTATNTNSSTTSMADMVEEASKAIVGIVNMQTQTQAQGYFNNNAQSSEAVEAGSGTGVVFKIDGNDAYIVTNNHVIENAQELEITVYGGEKTTAEIIGADSLTDLAVLKIDAKYATAALEFGDSSTLRAGDTVLAIGNPLGLEFSNTVTQGIVSAVDRTVSVSTTAGNWDLNVIQTDAAINPGNSGGALINTGGQVIGINSLKISEDGVEGLGFAIPSNDLVPIINEILENGQVERPYIGVGLASLEEIPQMYLQDLPQDIEGGAMVTSIDSGSAAAEAGLQVQDVIVSINDTEITSSGDLRKYLYSELKVGDKVTLKVYRDNELVTINLTLTSNNTTNS